MTIKRFLIMQAIWGGVLNAVLNGPPVLIILRPGDSWHLWNGFPSIALDTLGMSFGVAFGTGWLFTNGLRKQVVSGKVQLPRGLPPRIIEDFGKWPAASLPRGFNLGGLAVLACALPTIGVLFLSGVEAWGWQSVVTYKTLFGGVMGAVFTPLTAVGVMAEEEVRPQPPIEAVVPSEG
jgi:hypothetical protein